MFKFVRKISGQFFQLPHIGRLFNFQDFSVTAQQSDIDAHIHRKRDQMSRQNMLSPTRPGVNPLFYVHLRLKPCLDRLCKWVFGAVLQNALQILFKTQWLLSTEVPSLWPIRPAIPPPLPLVVAIPGRTDRNWQAKSLVTSISAEMEYIPSGKLT